MAGIFLNGKLYAGGINAGDGSGLQITPWESGTEYHYSDLVLYLFTIYQCTTANNDITFDKDHWKKIGSSDESFNIITSISYLPIDLTEKDKKLFYSTEDMCFYYWDGTEWIRQQKTASYDDLGLVTIDEETLAIDENGKLSIRMIKTSEINNLFS